MSGRRLPPPWKSLKLIRLYVASWKETFHDAAKIKKLHKVIKDFKAVHTSNPMACAEDSNLMARVEEIMIDHPMLLLGFIALFPERVIPTPPKARVSPSPVLTMVDAYVYMDSVEEAFYEEPEKYDEFLKILLTGYRADEASAIAKNLEELMKDHQDLL